MVKVIVDAMGGDNAPQAIVNGCVDALKRKEDFSIILVGNELKIKKILKERNCTDKRISICAADDVVTNHDEPSKVVKHKKNSSMVVAFELLKNGYGDAVLSCGSTGALLTCSVMLLKRIKGINRPALGTLIPTKTGNALLLDAGLNAECKPINFLQFGIMGSCYVKHLLNIRHPKVGLVNIGVEPEKGTDLIREAYEELKKADLTFIGNIEGTDIIGGVADVIVCDGFTGNVVLKVLEGTASFFIGELKNIFLKSISTKLSALFVKDGIKKLKSKVDVDVLGGAPILGIDGLVMKSHGNSNAKTIENSVIKACDMAKSNFVADLKRELEKRR